MHANEVEVYVSLGTGWAAGFEVVDAKDGDDGATWFTVRRLSDGAVLPVPLPSDRIRPAQSQPPPF